MRCSLILASCIVLLGACRQLTVYSPAEQESGYTYVPLDPFPIKAVPGKGCLNPIVEPILTRQTLLQALPDNAIRMLIEQFDSKGNVSYGPSKVQGRGESYRVTIDYIYSDTKNQSIFVAKTIQLKNGMRIPAPINASPRSDYVPGSEEYKVSRDRPHLDHGVTNEAIKDMFGDERLLEMALAKRDHDFAIVYHELGRLTDGYNKALDRRANLPEEERGRLEQSLIPLSDEVDQATKVKNVAREKALAKFERELQEFDHEFTEFNIPVYVGLGLRTSSLIYAVKGEANISGLGVIGAEAEANNLKGSLIIQTLGVNGKSVAAALPIQSELNRTTAQNAIVAIGTIKALLHSEETWIAPRVVGLYLPFPGGKALVNALVSELSKQELVWEYSCSIKTESTASSR